MTRPSPLHNTPYENPLEQPYEPRSCQQTHNCWSEGQELHPGIASNRLIFKRMVAAQLEKARTTVPTPQVPFAVFQGLQRCQAELAQLDYTPYAPHPRHYAKYLVYNFSEPGCQPFSLTLLVFLPGQQTPKHSHRVDCAPICLQGRIEETLYREVCSSNPPAKTTALEVIAKRQYEPFEGGYLHQHQPNTHHLENVGSNVAMSLHLYLFNALSDPHGNIGSSILRVYP